MLASDATSPAVVLFILLALFVAVTWRALLRVLIVVVMATLAIALVAGATTIVHGLQHF